MRSAVDLKNASEKQSLLKFWTTWTQCKTCLKNVCLWISCPQYLKKC